MSKSRADSWPESAKRDLINTELEIEAFQKSTATWEKQYGARWPGDSYARVMLAQRRRLLRELGDLAPPPPRQLKLPGLGRSFASTPRTPFDKAVREAHQAILIGDCTKAKVILTEDELAHPRTARQESTLRRLRQAVKGCSISSLGRPNVIGGKQTEFDSVALKAAHKLTVGDCDQAQYYTGDAQRLAKGRRQRKLSLRLVKEVDRCYRERS